MYKRQGYESVNKPLYIGLAWTDRPLGSAHEWQAQDKPVMSIHDKDAQCCLLYTSMGCCVRNGDIFALYFLSAAVDDFLLEVQGGEPYPVAVSYTHLALR